MRKADLDRARFRVMWMTTGYGAVGCLVAAVIVAGFMGSEDLLEPICYVAAAAGLITAAMCGRIFAATYLKANRGTSLALGVLSAGMTVWVGFLVGIVIPAFMPSENSIDSLSAAMKFITGFGIGVLMFGGPPAVVLGLLCGTHIHAWVKSLRAEANDLVADTSEEVSSGRRRQFDRTL